MALCFRVAGPNHPVPVTPGSSSLAADPALIEMDNTGNSVAAPPESHIRHRDKVTVRPPPECTMNHFEIAIDEALLMRSPRTVFVFKDRAGAWTTSINLPRTSTYYSVTHDGEAFLNCPDDPKPIRIMAKGTEMNFAKQVKYSVRGQSLRGGVSGSGGPGYARLRPVTARHPRLSNLSLLAQALSMPRLTLPQSGQSVSLGMAGKAGSKLVESGGKVGALIG